MTTKVPGNVFRFEVLLYISLTLDALSAAVQDRTPSGEITDSAIIAWVILNVVLISLQVYLVYLAAQHRKGWPRWVLLAGLVYAVISLAQFLSEEAMTLSGGIEIISCTLTAIGLYYSFTGDARRWFNA